MTGPASTRDDRMPLRRAEAIARDGRGGSRVATALLDELQRLRRLREADAAVVRTAQAYVHGGAELLDLTAALDARKAAQ